MTQIGNCRGFLGKCGSRSGTLTALRTATVALVLLSAAVARADSVNLVVTRGSVDAHEGDHTFLLAGQDFRLSGELSAPFSLPLSSCFPCAAGTPVSLSGWTSVHEAGDPAELGGVTYAGGASDGYSLYGGPFYRGLLTFEAGSIVVPSLPVGGYAEASAPFTFTGWLNGFRKDGPSELSVFFASMQGRGTATLQFSNDPRLGGIHASRIGYEFEEVAPVPEPATLVLIGSGLIGLALGRKRVVR